MYVNKDSKLRKIIASNIKYYREKANMSQEELSNKIGKVSHFVKKYEIGEYKRSIDIDSLDKIAKVLNVPIVDFMVEKKENEDTD